MSCLEDAWRWMPTLLIALCTIGIDAGALPGKELPIPIKVGQSYGQARQQLLRAGWKPRINTSSQDCLTTLMDRRCLLLPEIAACSHTGLGLCRYNWLAPDGMAYAVITSGGSWSGDPGQVSGWFRDAVMAPVP